MDQFDYAIVVALDEEAKYFTDIVRCGDALDFGHGTAWAIEDQDWRDFGRGVLLSSGKMGKDHAKATAKEASDRFGITLLANIGIAGRVHQDLSLGDVVVPSLLYDLTTGGKIGGKRGEPDFQHKPIPRELPPGLVKIAQRALKAGSPTLRRICRRLNEKFGGSGLLPRGEIRVVFDPLACVPTVGANNSYRESVSRVDRSIAAMDMESAGIIEAARELQLRVICARGISDGADFDKSVLERTFKDENRRLAMEAAIAVLQASLRAFQDAYGEAKPVPGVEVTACSPETGHRSQEHEAYEELFSLLVRTRKGDLLPNPISFVARYLTSEAYSGPIIILGDKGAGKTSMLRRIRAALADHLPGTIAGPLRASSVVLVEIGLIEAWDEGEIDEERTLERLAAARRAIRLAAQNCGSKGGTTYAVIDGLCQTGALCVRMVAEIIEEFCAHGNVRFVLSAESRSDAGKLYAQSQFRVEQEIALHPMDTDDPKILELMEAFAKLAQHKPDGVIDDMRAKEVRSVDLFLLSRFFRDFRSIHYEPLKYLAQYYALFCEAKLSSNRRRTEAEAQKAISEVAAACFDILIAGTKTFAQVRERDTYKLISSHPSVTSYLVARHVVELITGEQRKASIKDLNSRLSYVFPAEVNSYAKQMMLANRQVETKVIEFIRRRYTALGVLAQSHCAYLAGRVSPGRAGEMLAELRRMTDLFHSSDAPLDHDRRMLRRTIYISRSMLGDREATEFYAETLLNDVEEAEFNRGFHLEYYRDDDFTPDGKMSSRDDGLLSCNRTFSRLRECILSYPGSGRLPLIELLTLLSLVQIRNLRGTLRRRHREQALELIDRDTTKWRAGLSTKVKGYLGRIREDLALDNFRLATVLDEWLALCTVERSGWLRRRRDASASEARFWRRARIETIAEHTFSALALATVFLRNDTDGVEAYDRRKVLDMLLVHDLAESRVGDRLPGSGDPEAEQDVLWEYAAFSTYRGTSNLWWIPEVFQEFTAGQTMEARIAQDLDRLQFLLQSRTYGDGLSAHERSLCEAMADKITTPEVLRIKASLEGFPGPSRFATPAIVEMT